MCKLEKTRFSLLLLEPGEIYFEDFSAFLFTPDVTEETFESKRRYGRLKMCSKSLVFDPLDFNRPILKIPLKDCCSIKRGEKPWSKIEDNIIEVECTSHAEMLEGNVIAPYTFKHSKTKFLFLLNYAKVDDCIPQILQLHRASTLLTPEQNSMIATIVFSRQSRLSFDTKWLEDMYEKVVFETQANKISPLVVNPGRILLTSSRIYFQPYNNVESFPVLKINLKDIMRIICRRFLLKQVGIEIYCDNSSGNVAVEHLYLVLKSKEDRDNFYQLILKQPSLSLKISEQEIMTLKWQNRALSTYDYLLYLNSLADRSFNDLTQYPVFPWVLSDYTSEKLDLDNPESFRDLTKPIGAINEERLQRLKERRLEMAEPKFLYGSHYSAPGFVLFYLIRKYPHYMLCLQNGRFDHPDRMFNSMADVWRNVMVNMSDFKELIPEFYNTSQSGDFLLNQYGINFGHRHDGSKIHDVHLPPWAENPSDFVGKLRQALESDYVSENLHHWIDLIFGYKQRGEEAEKSNNVFYYLCYEGAIDVDSINDLNERHALEVQIMEFGQIPKQIFKIPHPQRLQLISPSVGILNSNDLDENVSRGNRKLSWGDVTNLTQTSVLSQHKDVVTCVAISPNNEMVLSGGKDSTVKIYSTGNVKQMRNLNISSVGIASCVFLPDNNIVVLGSFDDHILVYDIDFGKVIDSIRGHEDAVTSVCWGASTQCLVTSSWDCSVKVWRGMHQGSKWHRLKSTTTIRIDRDSRFTCASINSDNNLVGSGTEDGEVIVWNIISNNLIFDKRTHDSGVSAVSFSPDGVKLISCGLDGNFKVYDLLTSMEVYCKTFQAQLTCLAWDGFSLILGSNSGFLFFWDLIEVKLIKEVECLGKFVTCISVSNDGKLAVTGEDKLVVLRH